VLVLPELRFCMRLFLRRRVLSGQLCDRNDGGSDGMHLRDLAICDSA
jgi:hypothetical protein